MPVFSGVTINSSNFNWSDSSASHVPFMDADPFHTLFRGIELQLVSIGRNLDSWLWPVIIRWCNDSVRLQGRVFNWLTHSQESMNKTRDWNIFIIQIGFKHWQKLHEWSDFGSKSFLQKISFNDRTRTRNFDWRGKPTSLATTGLIWIFCDLDSVACRMPWSSMSSSWQTEWTRFFPLHSECLG
jgi:hypothetical protein